MGEEKDQTNETEVEERKKEAKFWRDKHVLEQIPGWNQSEAAIFTGVSPENYDKIREKPLLLEGLESPEFSIEDLKTKSIYELYKSVKIPQKVMDEILHIGDNTIDKFITERTKLKEDNNEEIKLHEELIENYYNMLQLFKEYIDLDEKYLSLICLWIIGASNHKEFISYPYLFFNAMKGSGKTRLLKLITFLCNGSMLNSLREAILFKILLIFLITSAVLIMVEYFFMNAKSSFVFLINFILWIVIFLTDATCEKWYIALAHKMQLSDIKK